MRPSFPVADIKRTLDAMSWVKVRSHARVRMSAFPEFTFLSPPRSTNSIGMWSTARASRWKYLASWTFRRRAPMIHLLSIPLQMLPISSLTPVLYVQFVSAAGVHEWN